MTQRNLILISIFIVALSLVWLGRIMNHQRADIRACQQLAAAVEIMVTTQPVDNESLAQVLKTFNVKFPAIVHAQAVQESGNFTSSLFGRNHNLFGMKHPERRVTTSLGSVGGYAYYATWVDSVVDYALWFQTYASECKTEDDVFKLLDKLYAQHPGYSGIIKDLSKKYSSFYE